MSTNLFKVNVSVVIFNENNEILIIKRSENEEVYPGMWGIPGGTVEDTDISLENALKREVYEEVGIEIEKLNIVQNNIRVKNDKKTIYIVYTAIFLAGNLEAKDGTEIVKWVKPDNLGNLEFTPNTVEIIKSVFIK